MQRVVLFDVPDSVFPHAVWAQAAQLLTRTLPGWDAWCPDDGRLAEGLAMIVRYLDEPAHDLPAPAALTEALCWLHPSSVVKGLATLFLNPNQTRQSDASLWHDPVP